MLSVQMLHNLSTRGHSATFLMKTQQPAEINKLAQETGNQFKHPVSVRLKRHPAILLVAG